MFRKREVINLKHSFVDRRKLIRKREKIQIQQTSNMVGTFIKARVVND